MGPGSDRDPAGAVGLDRGGGSRKESRRGHRSPTPSPPAGPAAAIVARARPRQLAKRDNWQWLTTAWAQYPGPLPRAGTPEEFFATEVASAKKQHLGLVTGVNLLGGGCGPVEEGRCLPDIPGGSLKGSGKNTYQLSAAEFVDYK